MSKKQSVWISKSLFRRPVRSRAKALNLQVFVMMIAAITVIMLFLPDDRWFLT